MWRAKVKDLKNLNLAGRVVEVRDHLLQTPAEELTAEQVAHIQASSAWEWIGHDAPAKTPTRTPPPAEPSEEGEGSKGGNTATFSEAPAEEQPAPKKRGRPRKRKTSEG